MKYKKLFIFLLLPLSLAAQENYEIQVYASPTMTKGMTMFELHSNYTFQGEQNIVKGVRPSYHALHETIEVTHGIADNFELGFYLFMNYTNPYGFQVVGTHLRPRFSAPASWKLPVGVSLSTEIGYQTSEYSAETWSVELRPIVDKTFGKLYVSLNPVLGFSLKGVDKQSSPEVTPNVKAALALTPKVSVGAEYYGNLGTLKGFERGPQQEHALFVVADLYIDPKWEINFGPGWGLTNVTDGLVVKFLLGRRIQWKKSK
jgi:hypothetical protein